MIEFICDPYVQVVFKIFLSVCCYLFLRGGRMNNDIYILIFYCILMLCIASVLIFKK